MDTDGDTCWGASSRPLGGDRPSPVGPPSASKPHSRASSEELAPPAAPPACVPDGIAVPLKLLFARAARRPLGGYTREALRTPSSRTCARQRWTSARCRSSGLRAAVRPYPVRATLAAVLASYCGLSSTSPAGTLTFAPPRRTCAPRRGVGRHMRRRAPRRRRCPSSLPGLPFRTLPPWYLWSHGFLLRRRLPGRRLTIRTPTSRSRSGATSPRLNASGA